MLRNKSAPEPPASCAEKAHSRNRWWFWNKYQDMKISWIEWTLCLELRNLVALGRGVFRGSDEEGECGKGRRVGREENKAPWEGHKH